MTTNNEHRPRPKGLTCKTCGKPDPTLRGGYCSKSCEQVSRALYAEKTFDVRLPDERESDAAPWH